MEISFKLNNQKFTKIERKFKNIIKEFNNDKKRSFLNILMTINFYLSDIEFMFYHGDFASIINNNDEPELYIYLKKFYYECSVVRKKKEEIKELLFPIFPFINLDDPIENLKFHDIVIQIKISNKDLFDLIIKYENIFKIVNVLYNKKNENEDDDKEENEDEEEEKEEKKEWDNYYETVISLESNNHDIIWLLLSLVSEKFITFYTLIKFLNIYNEEINILIKEPFLFIIKLRSILENKYTLTNNNIKFYNDESFFEFLQQFPNVLNQKQQKEYNNIKIIYEQNKNFNKYYYYSLVITPLTCYFEIPFLKKGIYLIEQYKDKIKSYDLIFIKFKTYKKINKINGSSNYFNMDTDIYNYYKFNIINKSISFFNLNYEYLGATLDDIKYSKCCFINSNKIYIKSYFNAYTEKQYLCLFELLFSTEQACYLCNYK